MAAKQGKPPFNPFFNRPELSSEDAAIAYVEAQLWPDGAICPHCGTIGEATKLKGKTTRAGLWKCRACRKPFTVRMGTVFESCARPDAHLASGDVPDVQQQKGNQHQATSPHLRRQPEDRMVPRPSHPRGHDRTQDRSRQRAVAAISSAARMRLSRRMKPLSAARHTTGRAKSRPKLRCSHWSSATDGSAASACRM